MLCMNEQRKHTSGMVSGGATQLITCDKMFWEQETGRSCYKTYKIDPHMSWYRLMEINGQLALRQALVYAVSHRC